MPRPEVYELGPPPSWSARASRGLDAEAVRKALEGREQDPHGAPARAAVLVPIVLDENGCRVLLIRRSPALSQDPSHVAFPGGHIEPGESDIEAALREAYEEIGLLPEHVEVLGCLDIAERRRDGARVTPVIGLVTGAFELELNDTEVEALLEVPLSVLLGEGCGWCEIWRVGATDREVFFFADEVVLGDDLVWGLTARILWDLLELITSEE